MNYEAITKEILQNYKIGRKYIGYDYILYGIRLMDEEGGKIDHITKTLYLDIARKFKSNSKCVERCIRSTVELMWKRKGCNPELLLEIFGEGHKDYRPTNTDFFELLYDYIENRSQGEAQVRCPYSGCKYCVCMRDGNCKRNTEKRADFSVQ